MTFFLFFNLLILLTYYHHLLLLYIHLYSLLKGDIFFHFPLHPHSFNSLSSSSFTSIYLSLFFVVVFYEVEMKERGGESGLEVEMERKYG